MSVPKCPVLVTPMLPASTPLVALSVCAMKDSQAMELCVKVSVLAIATVKKSELA